jgi:predicted nucleotidyltransferase component of viral defense system
MPSAPDRAYLDRISAETDFVRDPLEKVYRLLELLRTITTAPDIEGKLALKGGTALQFIYQDYRRLSVDIDFNYIGSTDREKMLEDREKIQNMLSRIFNESKYEPEERISSHAEEQNILAYTNSAGNRDRLKVELNYLERLPALPIVMKTVTHPFEILGNVTVPTYQYEELIAQKTRALITRATPRDLYDAYLISQKKVPYDWELYRKLTIFYLCLASEDVRRTTTALIDAVDARDIRRHLVPMLRRREYSVGLDELKMACLNTAKSILSFTDEEREFLDLFYDEKQFRQELLFGDIDLKTDLNSHPGVKWRLQS